MEGQGQTGLGIRFKSHLASYLKATKDAHLRTLLPVRPTRRHSVPSCTHTLELDRYILEMQEKATLDVLQKPGVNGKLRKGETMLNKMRTDD